jgi:hypothetical protein
MGFATLLGGMSTTIGTSPNLLVVSVAADMGMHRFQMFDFLMPAVIAGGLYIAPLPDVRIHAGDMLLVSETTSQLREFQALLGAHCIPGPIRHPVIKSTICSWRKWP